MIAIIIRELTERFRHGTTYTLLAVHAMLLAGLALAAESAIGSFSPWTAPTVGSSVASQSSSIGTVLLSWRGPTLFVGLTVWLLALIVTIVPALATSSFNGERRDGTFDLLILSGSRSASLVIAKLGAATVHAGLIILTAAPAFALVWVLGGVSGRAVMVTTAVLLSHLVLLIAVCLFVSSLVRHPATASVIGYGLVFLASALPFVGWLAASALGMAQTAQTLAIMSPITVALAAQPDFAAALLRTTPLEIDILPSALVLHLAAIGTQIELPLWACSVLVDAVLISILIAATAVAIEPLHPLKTMRLRRARAGATTGALGGTP